MNSNRKSVIFYLVIISTVLILFSGLANFYLYKARYKEILKDRELKVTDISQATLSKLENYIEGLKQIPEDLATFIENSSISHDDLLAVLKKLVVQNHDIYGLCPAFEEYSYDSKIRFYEPYFYKSADSLVYVNYDIQPEDYFSKDWYKLPKDANNSIWTEPYADSTAGMRVMTTYSKPFYFKNGKLRGVLATDIFLDEFQGFISGIKLLETGYVFLVTNKNTILSHPNSNYVFKETLASLSHKLKQNSLLQLADSCEKNKFGFFDVDSIFEIGNTKVHYSRISSGWKVVQLFPKAELLKDVYSLKQKYFYYFSISAIVILIIITVIYFTVILNLKNKQREYLEALVKDRTEEISAKNSLLEQQKKELMERNEEILANDHELKITNEELKLVNEKVELQKSIIEQNERRLKTILMSQGEGFALTDLSETFTFTNPAACEIFNLPDGALSGKNIKDFVDEQEWIMVQAQMSLRMRLVKTSYELTINLPGEIKKHLLVTGAPDIDISGNIVGTIATLRDITLLKNEQEKVLKLNDTLNKYFVAIEQNPSSITITDTFARIEYVNPKFVEVTGYSSSEVIGKNPRILRSGKTPADTYKDLWQTIRAGETWKGVFVNRKKDGTEFMEKTIITPIKDKNDNIVNFLALREDISELIHAEHEIKMKNQAIEEAHRNIKDSIQYAKTIQSALLTSESLTHEFLPDSFLIYKPRDVVSGDFYYINEINSRLYIAVADCTGHGVAGGFMTVLGITYLHEIIRKQEMTSAGGILDEFRSKLKNTFKSFGTENANGLDIALCIIDTVTGALQYSGANNPFYLIRNGELHEFKPTKNPIGFYVHELEFKNVESKLEDGDILYLFSDGYTDQFGGSRNAKYTKKKFRQLLLSNSKLSMVEQKINLLKELYSWQSGVEQLDDITILGFKWHL